MSKSPRPAHNSSRLVALSGASASGVIGVILLGYQWYIFGQRDIFTDSGVGAIYGYEYVVVLLGFGLIVLAFVLSVLHGGKK
ncbi:MAG TPA: hypothetical protein VH144_03855 [Candidatus Saccharimonadales bacterium]|jgi:hypothetical protein|nr:hypothetical protein [Candidatus Saccharimonadales bacterium]